MIQDSNKGEIVYTMNIRINLNLPIEVAKDYSRDLTQMKMINRRDGWTYPPALPKWEGGLSISRKDEYSCRDTQ